MAKLSQMSKILKAAPLALLTALGATSFAAPVSAAPALGLETVRLAASPGGAPYGTRYEDLSDFSPAALESLQDRIDWALRRGVLTRREAVRLQYKADALLERARVYWRSDGLSRYERRDLDLRFQQLRDQVRREIWDGDYRGRYREDWRERQSWGDDDQGQNEDRDQYRSRADAGLKGRGANLDEDTQRRSAEQPNFTPSQPQTQTASPYRGLQAPKSAQPAIKPKP